MFSKKLGELPKPMSEFIRAAGRLADDKGIAVYCVGGFVRDIMLGFQNLDVDLLVQGDGIAFALECASCFNLKVITHRRFGTATLSGMEGFKVDIASTRKEFYERPAVLPTVSGGTIKDDLIRRDFTINAMAICINAEHFGEVVDVYGGGRDLKSGLVRALHRLSFIDDPTRILRAVRFEQRFGFKIEAKTLKWIKEAHRKRMLHHVQKHRLRGELIMIFKESHPLKSLKRLNRLCGFSYISPKLRFKRTWKVHFSGIDKAVPWFKKKLHHKRHLEPYIMYLSVFFFCLRLTDIKKAVFEFALHKGESSRILSLKQNFLKVSKELSKKNVRPSMVYRLLEPLSYEVILLIMVLSKNRLLNQRVEDFLSVYSSQRLSVRGEDFAALGIKPGPDFKKILSELLYAKIDGKLKDREEELKEAQRLSTG